MSDKPIWRLLEECAQMLTDAGNAPFTRGDLIKCVQQRRPAAKPDSINPIIQGITDNLKGGAPGAVGKNLLRSIARGQFVLRSSIKVERSYVNELIDVRNRWAHQEFFSSDDADRALDSAGRLLAAISAPQSEDLEKLKMELSRMRLDEQVHIG